jgi:ABC-type amino acid transport system permease subunit
MCLSSFATRWGLRRVSGGVLLLLALYGLWVLPAQIEVFALEPHWPDARTLPAFFLILLTLALVARALLEWREPDLALGSGHSFLRVLTLALSLAIGIGVMQGVHGAAGLALIALLVAPLLSAGAVLKPTFASLVFALAAYAVVVFVLRIPLH